MKARDFTPTEIAQFMVEEFQREREFWANRVIEFSDRTGVVSSVLWSPHIDMTPGSVPEITLHVSTGGGKSRRCNAYSLRKVQCEPRVSAS